MIRNSPKDWGLIIGAVLIAACMGIAIGRVIWIYANIWGLT